MLKIGQQHEFVHVHRDQETAFRYASLQGFGRDVEIVYTGLRPGEKLFEELFVEGEEYVPTLHEKIFISRNGVDYPVCPIDLKQAVEDLVALSRQGDEGMVRAKLKEIVPEYRPEQGGRRWGEEERER